MKKQHWQDWIVLLLGAWVFSSPWLLPHGMTGEAIGGAGASAMWNLWAVGAAVALLGAAALLTFNIWEEWLALALGAWLLLSPWVLGFSDSTVLAWSAAAAGGLIVVLAGWTLAQEQGPTATAK